MITLTTFLLIEYQFFKKQATELLILKEDYQNYILAFKRVLCDYNKVKEHIRELEGCSEDEKKKSFYSLNQFDITSAFEGGTTPHFLVVNREFNYLRLNAIEFSKKHDLEDAVRNMYEFDEVDTQTHVPVCTREPKKVVLKNKVVATKQADSKLKSLQSFSASNDLRFQWPMEKSDFWLGSKFGPRKKIDGSWGFHYGLDMPAPRGTPVKASAAGVIVEVSYSPSGYGKSIVIAHNRKYKTRYAHLDFINVKNGQKVASGERIGKVGATGSVRGKRPYHLHFEVIVFGKKINPLEVLS